MKRGLTLLQISIPSLLIIVVLGGLVWLELKRSVEQQKAQEIVRVENQVTLLENIFDAEFSNVVQDLLLINRGVPFGSIDSVLSQREHILQRWTDILITHNKYQQIRFIDTNGDELLRIENSPTDGRVITPDTLQNKANRDYFINGIQLETGQVLITDFDLNQEFGQVQIPYNPTIRFIAKHPLGLIVINYSSTELFSDLADVVKDQIYLVNEHGYFLAHPNINQLWGWLVDRPKANFAKQHLEQWQALSNGSRYIDDQWYLGRIHYMQQDSDILRPQVFVAYPLKRPGSLFETIQKQTLLPYLLIATLIFIALMAWIYKALIRLQATTFEATVSKEKADHALSVKTRFLANMSHELRTPLNGIMGFFELLKNEPLNNKQMSYATNGFNSSKLLARILNDILDVSKLEANQLNISEHPFRLDTLLREVGTLLSSSIKDKSIELWFDVEPNLNTYLLGDDIRIRQILLNLCNNAIKFTDHGYVKLTVQQLATSDKMVTLAFSVEDTGIGISQANQARIFDSFVQVHEQDSKKYGGTGLGLHICQSLLALMDSQLEVRSEEHHGSVFSFTLKLSKAEMPHLDKDAIDNLNHVLLNDVHAIIYTDNALALDIIPKMTSNFGWPTFVCHNRIELLSQIQALPSVSMVIIIDRNDQRQELTSDLQQIASLTKAFSNRLVYMLLSASEGLQAHFASDQLTLVDGVFIKPLTQSSLYETILEGLSHKIQRSESTLVGKDELTRHIRILLVEDNYINQEVALNMLESEGYSVDIAENGQEALDYLKDQKRLPDIILMDMQMPLMDGITATQHIRKHNNWRHIPIIAMTANAMDEDKQACLAAGMNGHLAKPFEKSTLLEKIGYFTVKKHLN